MRIAFSDHRDRLTALVPAFRSRPLSYADSATLPERRTVVTIPTQERIDDLRACRLEFFFDYDIFPDSIVSAFGEWRLDRRDMRPGDIIVQQASVPPGVLSLKLIFAVRVLTVTRSATEMSFSYGTLRGHAEMGTSAFILSARDGVVTAAIQTHSRPAALAGRLVAPILVNPYQQYCTNRALAKLRDSFLRANES